MPELIKYIQGRVAPPGQDSCIYFYVRSQFVFGPLDCAGNLILYNRFVEDKDIDPTHLTIDKERLKEMDGFLEAMKKDHWISIEYQKEITEEQALLLRHACEEVLVVQSKLKKTLESLESKVEEKINI